jgi:hypothetical protein
VGTAARPAGSGRSALAPALIEAHTGGMTRMLFDEAPLLTRDETLALVPETARAHAACTIGAMPVVIPVTMRRRVGDEVEIAAVGGPRLHAALGRAVLAVEVDVGDCDDQAWCVILVGPSRPAARHPDDDVRTVRVVLTPQVVAARPGTPGPPPA